jgi:hypothetical protein
MNSVKDKAAVVTDVVYVILGASGHTGSIIANSLLLKGEKVRVLGRDAGRLQRFVRKGAEAFTANISDAAALTKAFSGARAAYLMLPPPTSREDQERLSDAIAKAVKESGLRYAVHLSSWGTHVPEGTGPIAGLHSSEPRSPENSTPTSFEEFVQDVFAPAYHGRLPPLRLSAQVAPVAPVC